MQYDRNFHLLWNDCRDLSPGFKVVPNESTACRSEKFLIRLHLHYWSPVLLSFQRSHTYLTRSFFVSSPDTYLPRISYVSYVSHVKIDVLCSSLCATRVCRQFFQIFGWWEQILACLISLFPIRTCALCKILNYARVYQQRLPSKRNVWEHKKSVTSSDCECLRDPG